ncbi:AAA family ATPase [Shigella flexneri]
MDSDEVMVRIICPSLWRNTRRRRLARLLDMSVMKKVATDRSGASSSHSVILLDEVEKRIAMSNISLQVLDDGRLTDGQGRTVISQYGSNYDL